MATTTNLHEIEIDQLPLLHESQRRLLHEHPERLVFKPYRPTGPAIVFSRFNPYTGSSQIYSIEPDGTNVQNLSKNLSFDDDTPAWSPDRTKIVFARFTSRTAGLSSLGLWLMNADGTQQVPLTTPPAGKFDVEPIWSPDGSKIAFQRWFEIWTVNADGSNAQPVIDYTGAQSLDYMPTWRFDSTAGAGKP